MSYGRHTYGKITALWDGPNHLTVGNFCSIARNVNVYLGGNHRTEWVTTYPFGHINKEVFSTFNGIEHPASKGDVVIGNDVWIAMNGKYHVRSDNRGWSCYCSKFTCC